MEDKKDINNIRNRGGRVTVGSADDGAIMEMFNIGGHLLIIKERSVYEVIMADDIDPKRENPNLPLNSQRLLFEFGTESEVFSRLFLLAKRLFKIQYLNPSIDSVKAIWLVVEMLQELDAMRKEIIILSDLEKKASDAYYDRKAKALDHATPSIPDIKTKCTTIFQKIDQFNQAQLALIREFYLDFSNQSYYSQFLEFVKVKYGEEDNFVKFIAEILPTISLSRNIRNCLDHRRTETVIKDFELQQNSNIISPTIEVDYNGSKLARTSLLDFLNEMNNSCVDIAENIITYISSKNLNPKRILPGQVTFIPEDDRINKYCKFAYWSPLGEGGFYDQN